MPDQLKYDDFDDGLLRATAGFCDNGYAWVSLALDSGLSDFSPEDLQDLGEQFSEVMAGNSAVAAKLRDNLRSSLSRLIVSSVTVHEETHFYQLISTPYGRLRSEVERYWLSDVAELCQQLAAKGALDPPDDAIPICTWIDRNLVANGPHYMLALYGELMHTQTRGFAACLSGTPFTGFLGHHIADLTIGDGLDMWRSFLLAEDRAEGANDTEDYRIQQTTHPSNLSTDMDEQAPVVPIIDGVQITPRAIFEGAAQQIQLDWARTVNGQSDLPILLRILNSGLIDPTYLRTRRLVGKRLPNVPWPARRSILLALSDLAFWGATHRDYVGGADADVRWEDLHPGYRFVRGLDVVAWAHKSMMLSELEDPLVVADLVCSALAWLPPVSMAENYLKVGAIASPVRRLGEDPLHDLRVRAAQARLTEPAAFIDGTNEVEVHEKYRLIMPFIIERGRLRMQDLPELYPPLIHSTLAHVASGMYDGHPSYLFNEPSNAREIAHSGALKILFGEQGHQLASLLSVATETGPGPDLAAELDGQTISDLERWLDRNDLHEWTRVVREIRLYHKSDAIDWFVRQPTIVEKVFNLIDVGEDGGVRVRSPEALKALAGVIAESDSVSLVELLEDCGIYLHAGLPSEQADG